MSVLFAILLFSLLIFVHELGHFLAAKLSGVQVNEFSMFMGPAIAKWQRGETLYSIRCLPIGGYCAMEGENGDSDNPRSFGAAAWWKRLIILVAGAAMNFLVGVLIVAIVLFCQPYYVTPEIVTVEPWSMLGGETGLQAGDVIVEFDGKPVRIYEDFTLATMLLPDGNHDITVLRNGEKVLLESVPMVRQLVEYEDGSQSMLYGISFGTVDTTAQSVPGRIWPTAINYVRSVFLSLRMLFNGQAGVKDMGGPVKIVQMMSEVAEASGSVNYALLNLLDFGAMIAINLAVMNLLPFPALDGGRVLGLVLTTAVEGITRKKIDPKYEGYIHAAGMIILLAFMGFIMLKDIWGLF